jgi:hypothetical protein
MLSDGFLDYEETKITMYFTKFRNVNIMILCPQPISSQLPYISAITHVVYTPHYIHYALSSYASSNTLTSYFKRPQWVQFISSRWESCQPLYLCRSRTPRSLPPIAAPIPLTPLLTLLYRPFYTLYLPPPTPTSTHPKGSPQTQAPPPSTHPPPPNLTNPSQSS